MPGARLDHADKTLTVSQSWLQDLLRCPERARWAWLHPSEARNDATAVGTAVHLFNQERLSGIGHQLARQVAVEWLEATMMEPDFKMVKVVKPETMFRHLDTCITKMERYVLSQVPGGGHVEVTLRATIARVDGWDIVLEGTPDYVDPFNRIWDWKSASGEWNVYEAATWAIQPTAYTLLVTEDTADLVCDFTYAVVVKPSGMVQFIDCTRTEQDWRWLARVASGALSLMLNIDGEWPVNHTHHLCSEKWCDHWDTCRGAFLAPTPPAPIMNGQQ